MKKNALLIAGCLATTWAGIFSSPASSADRGTIPAIPGAPRLACSKEAVAALVPDAEISSARWLASPVAYCRVDGVVHTNDPGPNMVGFMIALPAAWNGRYLMVVPGGSAGYVVNPSNEHLLGGYAVATTDKGSHSVGALDMSFRADAGKSLDYAHRGAHVATLATQKIALGYYDRSVAPRYIAGCSGGGVSTLTEALMYPGDADGFIAAAAPTDAYVQTLWAYIAQYVSQDPGRWISPADMARVGKVIMDGFDESDGVKDDLIWDPSRITLSRAMFPFLSDAQYSTLKLLENGLPAIDGSSVSAPGYWLANPSLLGPIALGNTPPPWTEKTRPPLYGSTVYGMHALRGPGYDAVQQMDFADPKQREEERDIWERVGGYDLGAEHLGALIDRGGRLIFWAGASDEAIPPRYVAQFSDEARKHHGEGAKQHVRSFFVPGMFHCRGGENHPTDANAGMLQAMQRWVEAGEAPEQVVLTNAERPIEVNSTSNTAQYVSGMTETHSNDIKPKPRSFLICAYPRRSVFNGDANDPADIADASKWACTQ